MVVDKDRFPQPNLFVICIDQNFHPRHQDALFAELVKFGFAVESGLSLGIGADSSRRNAKNAYRFAKGEVSGCINLALWHGIGHEASFF
jgi:hypothetical protein